MQHITQNLLFNQRGPTPPDSINIFGEPNPKSTEDWTYMDWIQNYSKDSKINYITATCFDTAAFHPTTNWIGAKRDIDLAPFELQKQANKNITFPGTVSIGKMADICFMSNDEIRDMLKEEVENVSYFEIKNFYRGTGDTKLISRHDTLEKALSTPSIIPSYRNTRYGNANNYTTSHKILIFNADLETVLRYSRSRTLLHDIMQLLSSANVRVNKRTFRNIAAALNFAIVEDDDWEEDELIEEIYDTLCDSIEALKTEFQTKYLSTEENLGELATYWNPVYNFDMKRALLNLPIREDTKSVDKTLVDKVALAAKKGFLLKDQTAPILNKIAVLKKNLASYETTLANIANDKLNYQANIKKYEAYIKQYSENIKDYQKDLENKEAREKQYHDAKEKQTVDLKTMIEEKDVLFKKLNEENKNISIKNSIVDVLEMHDILLHELEIISNNKTYNLKNINDFNFNDFVLVVLTLDI